MHLVSKILINICKQNTKIICSFVLNYLNFLRCDIIDNKELENFFKVISMYFLSIVQYTLKLHRNVYAAISFLVLKNSLTELLKIIS